MATPQTDPNIDHKGNVLELQRTLRSISYYVKAIPAVPIDGIFDSATTAGVEAFQSYYNLPVTGSVNEPTWNKIMEVNNSINADTGITQTISGMLSSNTMLSRGESGPEIYMLQVMINHIADRYVNIQHVNVNGVYDQTTETAVNQMKKVSLIETDITGHNTWNSITKLYNSLRLK